MEKKITFITGIPFLLIALALLGLAAYNVYSNWQEMIEHWSMFLLPILYVIAAITIFSGLTTVYPNSAVIASFMGKYQGTFKENGFWFGNPFYGYTGVSLKTSNYAMEVLKVNDKAGVPIEIAATIVYRIGDTYKAQYEVEDLTIFIDNQFEISLRNLAKKHTYAELATEDKDFIADLTHNSSRAGIEILDAKITHLNYVPEIAAVMLQKQQANALSDAKEIIVENAVRIAEDAALRITGMNASDKAKFVSNLIIVLCSEKAASPVFNISE